MNKKIKKILKLSVPIAISTGLLITAVTMKGIDKPKIQNPKFLFSGNKYNSLDEIKRDLSNSIKPIEKIDAKKIYLIKSTGDRVNNLFELQNYISSKIKSVKVTLKHPKQKYINKNNNVSFLSKNNVKEISFNENNNKIDEIKVFLGKNNVPYLSEEDAKRSYVNFNLLYKINDKFYRNLDDYFIKLDEELLKKNSQEAKNIYLRQIFDKHNNDNKKNDETKFLAPNGILSNFSLNDFENNKDELKKYVIQFIKNNSRRIIVKNNEIYDDSNINLMKIDFRDFNVIKVDNTNGENTFIVDIAKEDNYRLYGNYTIQIFANEVDGFQNVQNWEKRDTINSKIYYKDNKKNSLINNFLSNLMFQKHLFYKNNNNKDKTIEEIYKSVLEENIENNQNQLSDLYNFSIFDYEPTRSYFEEMKTIWENEQVIYKDDFSGEIHNVIDKLNEIINIIQKGKRGTFFNQIATTYFSGLVYLAKAKASLKCVKVFKNFYYKLIEDLSNTLKETIGDFWENDFDLLSIFQFDKEQISTNIDPNFFLTALSNNQKLVDVISVLMAAQNNVMFGTFLEYDDSLTYSGEIQSPNFSDKLKRLYDKYSFLDSANSAYLFDKESGNFVVNPKYNIPLKSINENQIHNEIILNKIILKGFIGMSYNSSKITEQVINELAEAVKNKQNEYDWDSNYGINLDNSSDSDLSIDSKYSFKVQTLSNLLFNYYKNNNMNKAKEFNKMNSTSVFYVSKIIEEFKQINFNKIDKTTKKPFFSAAEFAKSLPTINKDIVTDKELTTVKRISTGAKIADNIKSFIHLFKTTLYDNNNAGYNVKAWQNAISGWTQFIPPTPTGMTIALAANLIMEFIVQVVGETTTSDYVYVVPGNKKYTYIWDGGLTTTRFWGLSRSEDSKINEKHLLKPVMVIPHSLESYYYLNGKKGTKLEIEQEIKKEILYHNDDVFFSNNNYSIYYTMEKTDEKFTTNPELYFKLNDESKINELADKIITDKLYLKTFFAPDLTTITKNSGKNEYEDLLDGYKKFIRNSYKPIVVMELPEIENGKPVDQNYFLTHPDGDWISNDSIELINKINSLNSDNDNKFILYDTSLLISENNIKKPIAVFGNDLRKKLIKQFISKFDVASKVINNFSLIDNVKYTKLESSYKDVIFKVVNEKNEVKYFWEYKKAIDYVMSSNYLNIVAEKIVQSKKTIYQFNDIEFDNFDQMFEYCKKELIKQI